MKDRQTDEILEGAPVEPAEAEAVSVTGGNRKRKKRYGVMILLFVLLLLLGTVGIIYYKSVVYYRTHFFPNTWMNGIDCSNLEAAAVTALLDQGIEEYMLEVTGRECRTGESGTVLGTIVASDIDLQYSDTAELVAGYLEEQDELWWIRAYLDKEYSYSWEKNVIFDKEMLENTVKSWDACRKGSMKKAEDAYISGYSETQGIYEIVPETIGTEMNVGQVTELISAAVGAQETKLDLEEAGCYLEASVKQDDKKLTSIVDKVNKWLGTRIVYDWNGTEVILDYHTLHEWISMDSGKPILDEEKVAEFVKEQASEYDTYGRKKNFVTTLGVELTLSSRNYGWKTDREGETKELIQLIYKGSTGEREPAYSITARQKGKNDIGNSYVEADLTNQHLYLYQDGNIVVETDFVSGTMVSTYDCVTPEGIFGLAYKTKNAVLKGATYRTPVSYWMPFYGNYGMHDANWRGSFGGQIFITNGSHGCINLPPDKAKEIYEYVSEGFPVVCYYYQGAPYIGPPAVPEEPTEGDGEEGGEEGGWEEPSEPEYIPEEAAPPEEPVQEG